MVAEIPVPFLNLPKDSNLKPFKYKYITYYPEKELKKSARNANSKTTNLFVKKNNYKSYNKFVRSNAFVFLNMIFPNTKNKIK